MKPNHIQYHETRAALHRAKPRSERRSILSGRLIQLMTKQLKAENKRKVRG